MRQRRVFKKHKAVPLIKIKSYPAPIRGLTAAQIVEMSGAVAGSDRYAVRQDWRELIEAKSRFIPKIWGDNDA